MANLIIKDPTDQMFARARAIERLRQDPKLRERVNTEVSDRLAAKKAAEKPLQPTDLAAMKFLTWETVAGKLVKLNKEIMFTTLPDAKIAIGLKRPSRTSVKEWESAPLSPWERELVKRETGHNGPRPFLVAASRGWVAPYTDIITATAPSQIVCRSLKSILGKLILHKAFTWEEAEREFGFRLRGPGTEVKRERVPVTPQVWAEERPVLRIS